eukprot:SAG11_NODE_38224_length_253_cov_0.675325_1_plen_24_part_01
MLGRADATLAPMLLRHLPLAMILA